MLPANTSIMTRAEEPPKSSALLPMKTVYRDFPYSNSFNEKLPNIVFSFNEDCTLSCNDKADWVSESDNKINIRTIAVSAAANR